MAISRFQFLAPALLAASLAIAVRAADSLTEAGRPFITNYTPRTYEGHNQMWAAAQSPDGLIYFGNRAKVFEFDGTTWRRLDVPATFIRRLAFAADGRLYLGSTDELGYLERTTGGAMVYTSLRPALPPEVQPAGPVLCVVPHEDAVFFATLTRVFRWRAGAFKVWPFVGSGPPTLNEVDGTLYLHRVNEGLFALRGEEFELINRDPVLTATVQPAMVSADGGGALIFVRNAGAFRLEPAGNLIPWPTEIDELLRRARPRQALRLADGTLAIGTESEGVLLLSRDGRLLQRADEEAGLENQTILGLMQDREGSLWVNASNGTSRVEFSSPFSVFDRFNGLGRDFVRQFCRHEGVLYAVSGSGLYQLVPGDPRSGGRARFERLPVAGENLWALASHARGLVVGGQRNISLLADGRMTVIAPGMPEPVTVFAWSRSQPDRLFVGRGGGLTFLRFADGSWQNEGILPGFTGEVRSIAEDEQGALWLGTTTRGIVRVARPSGIDDWTKATVTAYLETHGLPANQGWTMASATALGIVFTPNKGVYRYDYASDRFQLEPRLYPPNRPDAVITCVTQSGSGPIWLQSELPGADKFTLRIQSLTPNPAGDLAWAAQPRKLQEKIGYGGARTVWWDRNAAGDEVVWVSGSETTVRIDLHTRPPQLPSWGALIRGVEFPLAAGHPVSTGADGPRVPYSREPIGFSFAATRFAAGRAHEYQTRLLGFDDAWSPWSPRTDASFTNLMGGPFTFEVRARDIDGAVSAPARYTFSVAPPWHLTGWAFFGYGLAALGGVLGFVRWRLRHAEGERERLEQVVAQRTAELAAARDQADDASQAKTAFLASMSHELRTPLNGVIGYAQVLMKDRELSEKNRERLRIVQTSGEHLLRMINEVLDFSKIEAGRMELNAAPFHLPQLLRDIAAAISTRAEQKELEFAFVLAPDLPEVVVGDSQKLRQIIDNLLSNAIKFTTRGEVRLHARLLAPDTVGFCVSDTGPGISEADRAQLFQPFHQVARSRSPESGTGLGLAISHRFAALMDSRLVVESNPGAGSSFSFDVRLPVLAVDVSQASGAPRAITGYTGPRRTVLVVDDVAVNRHVLRDLLQPLGFEVLEAASGDTALAMALPALAFVDLRMPGMSGLELARRLRGQPGGDRLKLVAMSASVLTFNRDDAFAAGCDDFLPKPFREADLLEKLGRTLRLEWTYAETAAPRRDSRQPFGEISSQLDTAVLDELLGCARRGEILALRERLAALRARLAPPDSLLDALDAMARSYRMEHIRELLERQRAARPSPSP